FYLHRLLFPFLEDGRAIYLQARTISSNVEPRWHNLRGSVPALYNSVALTSASAGTTVYLVEGFTDTLTLLSHNFRAVGLVGAGGLRDEWLSRFGSLHVVCLLDPDEAGRRAAERYVESFAQRGISFTRVELPSDVNEFFRSSSSAALELT
ncbi:toprim domain-containing protein, partial [Shouchella clausii]|uniref:toprim domain-containing protein n=1 Tax=Shouchella clausii TaxID=79880 RepID=UPI0026FB05B1